MWKETHVNVKTFCLTALCVAQFPGVTAISKSDIYTLNSEASSDSCPSLCIKIQAQEIQEKPTGSNS